MSIVNISCFESNKWTVLGKDTALLLNTSIACSTQSAFIYSFFPFAPRKNTGPKPEVSIQVLTKVLLRLALGETQGKQNQLITLTEWVKRCFLAMLACLLQRRPEKENKQHPPHPGLFLNKV